MNQQTNGVDFSHLGISPALLEILHKNKLVAPTPIQHQSIPKILDGSDILGIAQTGTGKTLAFGLPMIQKLCQGNLQDKGLIVVPTRELALQVNDSLKKIGAPLGLKTAVLIGGEDIRRQIRQLRGNPQIVIGTPGRLNDHLESKSIKLTNVKTVVLDEADRMLDMGFFPQIKKVLSFVPQEKQALLFSATMPAAILDLAQGLMKLPLRIEVSPPGTPASKLSQEIIVVQKKERSELLKNILKEYRDSVLIFTRTKFGASALTKQIKDFGHSAAEIHSNKSLNQRMAALSGFRSGAYRVLVATDIAARGIDVPKVSLVINFDLPENPEDYVHRIGRTGRAGASGHAITFALPEQKRDVREIERLIKKALPVTRHESNIPGQSKKITDFIPEEPPAEKRGKRGPKKFASKEKKRTYPKGKSHKPYFMVR